jgi:predicted kinase
LTVLVLVSGPPGAGKTTLAKQLGAELSYPVIDRDDIKDSLFDSLGWSDREWSKKVGGASWELLFVLAERLIAAGVSVILDSNFERGKHPQLRRMAERYSFTIVEVHCRTDDVVMAERFRKRWEAGNRHPGHTDVYTTEEEYLAVLATRDFVPVEESGSIAHVDTTSSESIDLQGIVQQIREAADGL